MLFSAANQHWCNAVVRSVGARITPGTPTPQIDGNRAVGKSRSFLLGKFIKQRYGVEGNGLLSNIYLQDEIALRSTDKERTKMTAQMAMAAVYPPEVEQQWDEGLGKIWQPVPYTAVPLSEDYLRYYSNCKRFKELMVMAKEEAVHQEFVQFKDLVTIVKKETGRNFTEDPVLFETLFDLFKSQINTQTLKNIHVHHTNILQLWESNPRPWTQKACSRQMMLKTYASG
ncbi:jg9179 [Pararge aegeria aegeria]|uniref:acid phosphatase n=1 Tax=Pararge aegeria aegeria TaxID=348720 RepID=A0A8S4QS39_9NEOP|nr:jg9179 [Pararge aegeria aegeria]